MRKNQYVVDGVLRCRTGYKMSQGLRTSQRMNTMDTSALYDSADAKARYEAYAKLQSAATGE